MFVEANIFPLLLGTHQLHLEAHLNRIRLQIDDQPDPVLITLLRATTLADTSLVLRFVVAVATPVI